MVSELIAEPVGEPVEAVEGTETVNGPWWRVAKRKEKEVISSIDSRG